tara:strand:- start:117 stop:350 length:234 start_codon:yes stop_codon:yes gene_type:complete
MRDFEIGDLVEVKKDNELSPTLRFFHNKKGMIARLISESHNASKTLLVEWEILFADGKRATFKSHELKLISRANKKS